MRDACEVVQLSSTCLLSTKRLHDVAAQAKRSSGAGIVYNSAKRNHPQDLAFCTIPAKLRSDACPHSRPNSALPVTVSSAVSCEGVQLLPTRLLSAKRLHAVADVGAILSSFFFSFIHEFFCKPTTAANATAAGKANLRTDRRQPADPQARNRAEHRTTANTANHTAADRQTHSRQTRQHGQQSRGTPTATANATNREARRTDRTSQQPKSHAHSRNAEQHATAAESGTPQTENGKPSKADDRDDQTNRQTTQQTPPDRQTKHDSPQRRPPRATSWLRGWRGAQCPVAR